MLLNLPPGIPSKQFYCLFVSNFWQTANTVLLAVWLYPTCGFVCEANKAYTNTWAPPVVFSTPATLIVFTENE